MYIVMEAVDNVSYLKYIGNKLAEMHLEVLNLVEKYAGKDCWLYGETVNRLLRKDDGFIHLHSSMEKPYTITWAKV